MKIDKKNGDVCFSEETHTYWNANDNVRYVSVTTLIGKFEQPYDKEFWSAYKALEKLIPADQWKEEKESLLASHKIDKSLLEVYDIEEAAFNKEQQGVLDMWQEENAKSCERGTKIHLDLENAFYKAGNKVSLKKFGIGGTFECRKDYSDLDLPYGVYPEYLIYRESDDKILRIAGQVDCIVKNGNEITIIDHKTNKKIEKKSYYDVRKKASQKMKYPLTHLDDCNFIHYTLQLSTYAWMLQKLHPEFVIKDLILNHYDHEGNNTLYHCDYLKADVEKMLKFYKKQIILDERKEANKPIEY